MDGPVCISTTCPEHKCNHTVPASSFQKLVSTEYFDKYNIYCVRNCIDMNKTMRWCPTPGCGKVVISSGVIVVSCTCLHLFCFRCGESPHDPCTCNHIKIWLEKCEQDENNYWIHTNTKKCPGCTIRIEKNEGCNHMTCSKCG